MPLDQNDIGSKCHWFQMSLVPNAIGSKCHWFKMPLAQIPGDYNAIGSNDNGLK